MLDCITWEENIGRVTTFVCVQAFWMECDCDKESLWQTNIKRNENLKGPYGLMNVLIITHT